MDRIRMMVPWAAAIVGLAALLYGLSLVYEPLAWIIGGGLVSFVAVVELAGARP